MRHTLLTLFAAAAALIMSFLFFSVRTPIESRGASREKPDDAWDAFQWWYSQRAFPHELIPQGAFQKAALYARTKMRKESPASVTATPPWVALGPNNVGGRVLSIAVNPSNTDIVWAGSASGGLWKSTSGGEGSTAWSYVATGFPALAVSTIAIDPANTQVMYIGTGEISGYHRPQVGTPGARSSYGMGILKSTDGGTSWVQTGLTWTFPQVTAVEKIAINPMHTQTLFAAASEGVFKSTNAGATWFVSDTTVMAMDIAIHPSDSTIIYATHGNLNSSPNPGLFQSLDAGLSWLPLTNGIPSTNFGRAVLSISPSQPSRVYVAIANASTGVAYGLYRSDDDGGLWTLVSDTNFTGGQGWYDIAVGVKPNDPNRVFTSGLDIFRSTTSGTSPSQQSVWYAGYYGAVPPGGPEGPPSYAHADHHAIAFDPVHPDTIYFGCDGGVFKSTDGGGTYFGCNGGLATTQFYNGFANAFDDSLVAIGGLQDNGVVKYQGSTTWSKVDGGDGGWNAIDPTNNNVMYDEYVYLTIKKAINGLNFSGITSGLPTGSGNANFIAPFAISTSSPNILYAGNKNVYKTTSGGANWFPPNGGANLNGTKLACIGVSYTSPDTLLAGTGTSSFGASPLFQVFASTNGGQSWTNVTGTLPARYPTDVEFDPTLSSTVYLTYSGYGGPHVFRSTNVGQTWTDISGTLPDIPHQTIAVDPAQPGNLYVGTDLGVFHSSNAGASWEDFSTGMVPAMILDLAVSRRNGVLRAATFGNGVFERKLARTASVAVLVPNGGEVWQAGQSYFIQWSQQFLTSVKLEYSTDDGGSWNLIANNVPASPSQYAWTIPSVNSTHARVRVSDGALTSDASNNSFTLILNPDVVNGWNLISLRLAPPDPRKSVLFPSASSPAFAYTGSYIVRDSLSPGSGYWLKFNSPGFVTYTGDSLSTDSIPVKTGWNMIGSISKAVGVASIIPNPAGIVSSRYFGYGSSGYFVASTISPGGGYWVKTSADGTLVLQSTSTAANRVGSGEEGSRSWRSHEIVDAADRHQRLYLALEDGGLTPGLYEMPPPAPAGTLDARFSSGRMMEALNDSPSKEFGLSIVTPAYPVRIGWDMKAEMPDAVLLIGDRAVTMGETGQTAIANADTRLRIRLGGSVSLPVQFSLGQNYPNPFNPGTQIEFRIPDRHTGGTFVSLKIYDILGREVATVVNEVKQPGVYQEEWTAKNLPSGIYMYRLIAGSFTSAKKMLLIR